MDLKTHLRHNQFFKVKNENIFYSSLIKNTENLNTNIDSENNELLMNIENVQSYYNIHLLDLQIYTDYVFLDNDERRRFAQSSHEYLIEQVQINEFSSLSRLEINLTN